MVAVFTTFIWPDSSYQHSLVFSLCIGLSCWAVIEIGRRLWTTPRPPGSTAPGWPPGWRGMALTALGIGVGFTFGSPLAGWLLGMGDGGPRPWLGLLITVAAGSVASFYFHARGQAAALAAQAAAAERDAAEARLRLLQSQLAPHMLFNTLANLRALIAVDAPAAQHMLDRLNAYLRATLNASRATMHPLSAEFERLDDYLALMAVRMGPRLQYQLHLPDALRDVPIPPLLLQPLVENAIQHGLEPQVAGGRIDVQADMDTAQAPGWLRLTVRDSGVGFDPDAPDRQPAQASRFGLAQVTERVASAYGGRGTVQVQSQPGQGTTITLRLPPPGETA